MDGALCSRARAARRRSGRSGRGSGRNGGWRGLSSRGLAARLEAQTRQDSSAHRAAAPAGGQPGHRGVGRELRPEDQVDEIVDHFPDACGGCGHEFTSQQRRPKRRFGRHQVAELPPISVRWTEHRTHQLRCRHCLARTSARLPDGIADCAFGPRLQAAFVTLTARHRVSRRGMVGLAADLFGVALSTGAVDAICRRASDALGGPHLQLQDWVLDQDAVHVDETGWRTRGEGRALWTATTPDAAFFVIAEHCNRDQFNALIGTQYPGIVVSGRWAGYSHLDPHQRQVCWSHLQRDFRRHADGLGEQKTFGEKGVPLTKQVFAAWRAYQHEHHDRQRLQSRDRADPDRPPRAARGRLAEEGAQSVASAVRQQRAQGLARALDVRDRGRRRAHEQSRRARASRTGDPPQTLARDTKQQRRAIRRTRALRSHHLPNATPLAVHLPERAPRRPHPRRPVPRAHLSSPKN